jgi:hypothetical protein
MSTKTESPIPEVSYEGHSLIQDSNEGRDDGILPLRKANREESQSPLKICNFKVLQQQTPFKEYPLPVSPIKSLTTTVLNQQRTPLPSIPSLKPTIIENDVFAISPGMFPRKTKPMDYLDILADANRSGFVSPIKDTINQVPQLAESSHEATTQEKKECALIQDPEIEEVVNVENVNESMDGTSYFNLV